MICIAKSRRPLVCMFDSGIGGLNLLYACRRCLPGADYYYLADNYLVPYGNLAEEEVTLEFDKSGLLAIHSGSTRYLQSPMRPPAHTAIAQKAA